MCLSIDICSVKRFHYDYFTTVAVNISTRCSIANLQLSDKIVVSRVKFSFGTFQSEHSCNKRLAHYFRSN